jgi:cytochrome oxidase Cu insertion factor (SCO1/SenC/PrrC family)
MAKKIKSKTSRKQSSLHRMAWVFLGVGVVLVVALVYIFTQGPAPYEPTGNVQPGVAAPDFTLDAVRGGAYHLADLEGQVVLLSFLNTQAEAGGATSDPSRSQIVFLRSMETQYSSKGVFVFIVDATYVAAGENAGADDLINFTYDWNLDNIPVLVDDPSSTTAREYGVSHVPTTFLIDADGVVNQRWEGFASAPQLAFALEALVGRPEYAEGYSPTATPQSGEASAPAVQCDETPAQAKFAGLSLARPLSDEIWVVDSGRSWDSGRPIPLAWVVLGGEGDLRLQVTARGTDSDEGTLLVDETISPIPEDEAQGMLVGWVEVPSNVYLAYTSVVVDGPACLRVEAVVTREGETSPLFNGEAFVRVQ